MNQSSSKASLFELSQKVSAASLEFDRQQALLQVALQQAIHRPRQPQVSAKRLAFFEGAWLPGPLSYPWLLVIASLPGFLDVLFRTA